MRKFLNIGLIVALSLTLVLGAAQAQDQNIVEIASSNDDFSTLVTAVEAAGLVDVLADPEAEWTVFAPTNAAFEALPEGTLDMLLADTELLTRVLTYHVVEGTVTSDMISPMAAPSMEMTAPGAELMGSELEITVADDGTVMVNDATVVQADILAINGVIHVIDSVLVPPEIAAMMQDDMGDDMGEMDMMGGTLYATLNPAELENDAIITVPNDLASFDSALAGFTEPVSSIESIDFGTDGTAYLTVDQADGTGGVQVISGLTTDDDAILEGYIAGASTTLSAPKGIEVIDSLGVIVVANFGANSIVAFPTDADGDVAPAMTIDSVGEGSVWDVIYVEESDTLYAAGTAGDVLVYESFSSDMGQMGPARVIAPSNADGEKVTINLHALAYVAEQDTLIVTDVGAADNATDGHIYAIPEASTADGNVTVSLHILGPESLLGNPVDIVWDGSGVYIAEKANDAILYFGNLLDMSGMMDSTPTYVLEIGKPESVAWYGGMDMMDDMGDMDMEATEEAE